MQMPQDPAFRAAVAELLQTPEFANHPLNRRGGGTALDSPEAVATLQLDRSAPARQRFAGEPAKWQASMGPAAQAILAANSGAKNFDDLVKPLPSGGFDYSKVKPMRTSEELMSNPEFVSRMRTQPGEVSGFYEAVTGRGMSDDLKLRIKEENDRNNDIMNSLRSGFLQGRTYADPDTGILLQNRTTEIQDPTNPLGGTKLDRKWIAAPADLQLQWQANAPRILGRPAKMGPTATALKLLEKDYPEASQHFYNSLMRHMEGGAELPQAVEAASVEVKDRHSKIMEDKLQRSNNMAKLQSHIMDTTALALGIPWLSPKIQQEMRIKAARDRDNAAFNKLHGIKPSGPTDFSDVINAAQTQWYNTDSL